MKVKSVKKCRTCLRNSTKTFPLNDFFTGAKTKSTYGQLLQECARIEYSSNYEHLMPQNLCTLCCQELSKACTFIQKAQYCNNKLLKLLAKKLQNVKSENERFEIKSSKVGLQDADINNIKIVNTNFLLKSVELEEINEEEPIELNNYNTNEVTDVSKSLENSAASNIIQTNCPICQKTVNGPNNLKSHIRIYHDIKAPNKYIKQVMLNEKCEKTSIKRISKERFFKCSSCDYSARTYGALDLHNRSKHGTEDDKFKCNFCSHAYWTKFKLFLHIKKSHKNQIKALKADAQNKKNRRCTKIADTEDLNTNNLNDTSKSSVLQTINTAATFHTTDDQKEDQLSIISDQENDSHSDINDQEREDISNDLFIRKILNIKRRQYSSIPTNLLPRRCDECGNIYNNVRALKSHKKNVHITEEQYSICPHCGKKFKRPGNMSVHIQTVHNPNPKIRKKPTRQTKEKNLMCSQCSYVCCNKTLLTNHINRHHTGEKPYKCDVCNKSFVIAFNLKIHRYLHTGEKPYKCSFCSKRFRCSELLVKHKRIHTNERPYKCQECNKTFTQCYNLTLHKRVHIKAKNLKCTVCDTFFENQNLLNTHRITEEHYEEVK